MVVLLGATPARADDLFDNFTAMKVQAQALATEAEQASMRAAAHPFAPPEGFALSGEFARRINAFSALATSLVKQLDARGGPKDLRCIYRGMGEDANQRLAALHHAKNAGEQAVILKDMAALFTDAVDVTPDDPNALADHHDGAAGSCKASPDQKVESPPGQ